MPQDTPASPPDTSYRRAIESLCQQALESVSIVDELTVSYDNQIAVNRVLRSDIDRVRRLVRVLRSDENEASAEAQEAYNVAADLIEMVLISGISIGREELASTARRGRLWDEAQRQQRSLRRG